MAEELPPEEGGGEDILTFKGGRHLRSLDGTPITTAPEKFEGILASFQKKMAAEGKDDPAAFARLREISSAMENAADKGDIPGITGRIAEAEDLMSEIHESAPKETTPIASGGVPNTEQVRSNRTEQKPEEKEQRDEDRKQGDSRKKQQEAGAEKRGNGGPMPAEREIPEQIRISAKTAEILDRQKAVYGREVPRTQMKLKELLAEGEKIEKENLSAEEKGKRYAKINANLDRIASNVGKDIAPKKPRQKKETASVAAAVPPPSTTPQKKEAQEMLSEEERLRQEAASLGVSTEMLKIAKRNRVKLTPARAATQGNGVTLPRAAQKPTVVAEKHKPEERLAEKPKEKPEEKAQKPEEKLKAKKKPAHIEALETELAGVKEEATTAKEEARLRKEIATERKSIAESKKEIAEIKAGASPEKIAQAANNAAEAQQKGIEARTPEEHKGFFKRLGEKWNNMKGWKKLALGAAVTAVGFLGFGAAGALAARGAWSIGSRIMTGLGIFATLDESLKPAIRNRFLRTTAAAAGGTAFAILLPKIYADFNNEFGITEKIKGGLTALGVEVPHTPSVPMEKPKTGIGDRIGRMWDWLRGFTSPRTTLPLEAFVPAVNTYSVHAHDTITSILKEQFPAMDLLPAGQRETAIQNVIHKLAQNPGAYGIASGNVDMIRPGDSLDLKKIAETMKDLRLGAVAKSAAKAAVGNNDMFRGA